ncbi:MAG: hypothetical protein EOP52_06060 [Sphingobacteriales bacterium]|nr:MAG: hypothetical protein EOP52_06060 [Sphingobacteriales bacterium]
MYPYTDHLGSIVAVTNGVGTVVQRQAFDAWGRRRHVGTWETNDSWVPGVGFEWLRGFTGHEHLDGLGIINMNARLYDPKMARMFSVDNYVSDATSALGYNRYAYGMNNPISYVDPSGNFLAIPFAIVGFLAEFSSNLITGQSDAAGRAMSSVKQGLGELNSVGRIGNQNFSVGLNILNVGVDVQFSGRSGNTSFGGSIGVGITGFYAGASVSQQIGNWQVGISGSSNGDMYSIGGGGGYNDGKTALGYYQTYYGGGTSTTGENMSQWVGGISFRSGDFSLSYENDFLAFRHGDAWRTHGIQIGAGDFVLGSYIYTNDGAAASQNNRNPRATSPLWKENGRPDGKGGKYSAWTNGQTFRAPVYAGYKNGNNVSRTGYSAKGVQDFQQNWMHQSNVFPPGNQNYYLNYDYFQGGTYLFGGYSNPYSLFDF